MDEIDRRLVRASRKNAVDEMRLYEMAYFRRERMFHLPGSRREIDDPMRRVIGALGASEVLGREEEEMVIDGQHFALGVKVVDGRGIVAAGNQSQGAILDHLQAIY